MIIALIHAHSRTTIAATTRCRINGQQGVQYRREAEIARDARFDAGLDRPDGIRDGRPSEDRGRGGAGLWQPQTAPDAPDDDALMTERAN